MSAARFVALEGVDGSGKSTQAERLALALGAVLTREPGATAIGRLIRGVLLDPAHDVMAERTEALLLAADRAQHLAEVVEPALAAGRHVVSDRSAWSSVAYQGYGRGLPVGEVVTLNDWAVGGRWPDLVVVLDADPLAMARRRRRGPDRIEQADDEFHTRVRQAFLSIAAEHADHFAVVPAEGSVDDVAVGVLAAVHRHLGDPA